MIPRRRPGEQLVETLCSSCLRETYHVQRRGRWCCLTCGQANDPAQLPLFRPSQQEAEARRRYQQLHPLGERNTASSTAFGQADTLRATDSRRTTATHARPLVLPRRPQAREQPRTNVAGQRTRAAGRARPDDSMRYILLIESGWPRESRGTARTDPQPLALAEMYAITISGQLHLPRPPGISEMETPRHGRLRSRPAPPRRARQLPPDAP